MSMIEEERPYLCRCGFDKSNFKTIINAFYELTEEDCNALVEDCKTLEKFNASQNVTRALVANRNDLLEDFVGLADNYLNKRLAGESALRLASFELSRKLANLCSLFRSFLDHQDRYFVKNFGNDSLEYTGWRHIKSAEYDGNISYKIIYHLRNYIQHYDMPPLKLSLIDTIEDDGITISVNIDVKSLMLDEAISKKIPDLRFADERTTSIINIISEWNESLFRIIDYIDNIKSATAMPSARRILELFESHKILEGEYLAIGWFPKVRPSPEKLQLTIREIPKERALELIERTTPI